MNILSTAVSVYMLVIVIRIILTWFNGVARPPQILCSITDPYLNWFRRFSFLRVGYIDISPIVALGVLSIFSQIFNMLAQTGRITIGIIAALVIRAVWSALSFFIVFIGIILLLRLFAYISNRNIYGTFWRVIDTISQPILYRINRMLFGSRIVKFQTGILISIGILVVLYVVLSIIVGVLWGILTRSPV